MALTETTKISISLGAVVAGLIAGAISVGGWMWHLQEQIYEIRQDVAVIKATVAPSTGGRIAKVP